MKKLILTILVAACAAAGAQSKKFERYCAQLAAPVPQERLNANSKTFQFRRIGDFIFDTDQVMRKSIDLGLDYDEFKDRAGKNIPINSDYHAARYAELAREKCGITEGGAGNVTTAAHYDPTDAQATRRVDDSGIGAARPGSDGDGTSSSATDGDATN